MRLLEWLLLFAFVPVVLLPLVPQSWRPRWLLVAAPLPLLATLLQIVLEGWRAQMIPLYLLAGVTLLFWLPVMLRRRSDISRLRLVLSTLVVVVGMVGGGVLAAWLLPVFTLPAPTGPYAVGIVDREIVDSARDRRLMTSVWYPAASSGPPAPFTAYPDEMMAALADASGLPELLFQHLRYVKTSASQSAPILAGQPPFPVLVFSHGLTGMRSQSSSTMQELASWGYVVVAIDHTDAAAVTVFPDGEVRPYDDTRFGLTVGVEPSKEEINSTMFPVWVADQRYVYDTLEAWDERDPLLQGKLNLAQIGSFGHSFGGATSLDVCLIDARCQAAVDLDGGLYGQSASEPATRPILLMISEESAENAEPMAEWQAMEARANGAAYWLEIPHTSHLSFTFMPLMTPALAPSGITPQEGLQVVDRYLRAFFDRHLRGIDAPPLEPAANDAAVIWLP